MSTITVIVTPEEMEQSVVVVGGAAHHHLFRARRLASGEPLRLVDGRGRAVGASVRRVSRRSAEIVVGEAVASNEPRDWLEIWAALPRPQRASWLVEKTTELGVCAVRWIDSERAGRRPTPAALERLERVAAAAVEQCGRSRVPQISGPHSWGEVVEVAAKEPTWLLDPGGVRLPRREGSETFVLLVGPEGGFTSAERDELDEAGVSRLSLGERLLRVETAAVAGAAVLLASQHPSEPAV